MQKDKNAIFKNKTNRTISFSKIEKTSQKTEASILEDEFPEIKETNTIIKKITPDLAGGSFDKYKKGISVLSLILPLPLGQFDLSENKPGISLQQIEPVKKADIHLHEGWQMFVSVGTPWPRNSFGGNRVTVGLGYVHRFSRKWSVMATGAYRSYFGNKESVEFDKVTYGFVRKNEHYKLDVSKIHYATLYSSLGYHFAPRHALLFGLDISKFITAHGELETRKEIAQEFEAYSPVNSGTGYRKAFYSWNADVQMGYQYIISHRTTLGIVVQYPLISILKTEYQNKEPKPLAYGHLFLIHQLRK